MGFRITSGEPKKMYPGQIISYQVGILPGLKSNWVTEITHIGKFKYFVDEQRFGPYKMWHHEHHFEQTSIGTRMIDIVSYKLPFGFIGRIAHTLFVKKQLNAIFSYRYEKLNALFNA